MASVNFSLYTPYLPGKQAVGSEASPRIISHRRFVPSRQCVVWKFSILVQKQDVVMPLSCRLDDRIEWISDVQRKQRAI